MSYLMIIKESVLVREWVVGQWEEDEQVSLAEELSTIHVVNLLLNYLRLTTIGSLLPSMQFQFQLCQPFKSLFAQDFDTVI